MEKEVIARRVPMGPGMWTLLIVELILGIGFIVGGVFLFIYAEPMFYFHAVLLLVVGVWMEATFAYGLIRSIKNKKAGPDCLAYYPETEEFELYTIFSGTFRVKKGDILTMSRNFWTDFMLVLAIRKDGATKKVRLGWTLDVPTALPRVREIQHHKEEEGLK